MYFFFISFYAVNDISWIYLDESEEDEEEEEDEDEDEDEQKRSGSFFFSLFPFSVCFPISIHVFLFHYIFLQTKYVPFGKEAIQSRVKNC